AGPLAGSIALTVLPELLTTLTDYRLILYGVLLLVSIYWLPGGVVGAITALARRSRITAEPAATPSGPSAELLARTKAPVPVVDSAPLLGVDAIGVAFGGIVALADVTLTVPARGIVAVIGPNGAGKTTLLNLITGYYRPASGRIHFAGVPITGLAPHAVARRGVTRTFQNAQLFDDLTVIENVMVGVARARLGGLVSALLGAPGARRRERE